MLMAVCGLLGCGGTVVLDDGGETASTSSASSLQDLRDVCSLRCNAAPECIGQASTIDECIDECSSFAERCFDDLIIYNRCLADARCLDNCEEVYPTCSEEGPDFMDDDR
jgi:hypothetical protein